MLSYCSLSDFPNYAISNTGLVLNKVTGLFLIGTRTSKKRGRKDDQTTQYLMVNIGGSMFYVHILVCTYFVPNPHNLPVVNHIDSDSTNNNYENLEWVTRVQNNMRARKTRKLNRNITSEYKGVRVEIYKRQDGVETIYYYPRFNNRSYPKQPTERMAAEFYNKMALEKDPKAIVNTFND